MFLINSYSNRRNLDNVWETCLKLFIVQNWNYNLIVIQNLSVQTIKWQYLICVSNKFLSTNLLKLFKWSVSDTFKNEFCVCLVWSLTIQYPQNWLGVTFLVEAFVFMWKIWMEMMVHPLNSLEGKILFSSIAHYNRVLEVLHFYHKHFIRIIVLCFSNTMELFVYKLGITFGEISDV